VESQRMSAQILKVSARNIEVSPAWCNPGFPFF